MLLFVYRGNRSDSINITDRINISFISPEIYIDLPGFGITEIYINLSGFSFTDQIEENNRGRDVTVLIYNLDFQITILISV